MTLAGVITTGVQRGRVNAHRLDGGTALTNNGQIVEKEAALAFAHAARNGHDVAQSYCR